MAAHAGAAAAVLQDQIQPRQADAVAPVRSDDDAAWADAMRAIVDDAPRSGGPVQPLDVGASAAPREPKGHAPGAQAPFALPSAGPGHAGGPLHERRSGAIAMDDEDEPVRPKRSWIGVASAAVAVILIVAGVGWFTWQNRTLVTGAGATAIDTVLSTARPTSVSTDLLRAAPYQAAGETKEEIDASLQKIAVWRYLKREFADWYGEIVGEIERRRAQRQDERAITQFMVDVIVMLRRRNAQLALQSSPNHLRSMAAAFVTNLKQLGSRDGATCFAFVSHGESSPFMIELSRTPAFSETLQKQMLAVFEAVVDARSQRKIHANTRRADYERLTAELTSRGWTQNDLATFSDPQKLSTSLPDKVCVLVQEWFATQLELKDGELQSRLLAESLKPLVGG